MRYLPFVIQLALLIFALIDCIQTDSALVRNLPKPMWVLLIIFVPLVGPIVWLVAGRPQRESRSAAAWPATATSGFPEYERPRRQRGPDDDAAFLAGLQGPDPEKEELLRRWEEQLRQREAAARDSSARDGADETSSEEDDRGEDPASR